MVMEEARELLTHYWINRSEEKELYFMVKHEMPKFRKFFTEQLGWRLIVNEQLIKLEKVPAHAEPFMGIQVFTDIRDYCILCSLLIFLEDREDDEQFLLSELVDMITLQLKEYMELDWTEFTQRKSLIRTLQFAEERGLLRVYEGASSNLTSSMNQEVLYENTGLSRYFATNFNRDIATFSSYRDFERENVAEVDSDRGHYRINRVYRELVTAPAMYWSTADDPDAIYVKNQRQWVAKNLVDYLGGVLQIHRGGAFFVMEEADHFGLVHPNEAMLSGIVLLFCEEIRQAVAKEELARDLQDCIVLEQSVFMKYLDNCKGKYRDGWSKEYREMSLTKMTMQVMEYMQQWMMLKPFGDSLLLYPAVGKFTGEYPKDFSNKAENKDE
jgi:uncharacterized protein (TIGR02678 family)